MAGNDKRKQERLARKKAKRKIKAKATGQVTTRSGHSIARAASQWELYACDIDASWQEDSFGNLVVARISPNGSTLCTASALLDFGCLGVKDVAIQPAAFRTRFDELRAERIADAPRVEITSDDALRILSTARDYGHSLAFPQAADLDKMLLLLADADADRSTLEVTTGRDGKPFYIAGPRDNAQSVIRHLTNLLGPDGFDFIAHLPM